MSKGPGIGAYINCSLLSVLPQHWLSGLMYRAARCRWRWFKNAFIRTIVRHYGVNVDEAADPNFDHYDCFNAFFTRALRPDTRPQDVDPRAVLCPVDGAISQLGRIDEDRVIQAKGRDYRLEDVLGGGSGRAHAFTGGAFATLYLAPRDYHRIHMPLAGDLTWMRHIPGRLFSVNETTATLVPRLFARNERVVCGFDTEAGAMAMVLVGAIFVGGIETVWAGQITPARAGRQAPGCGSVRLERGAEMGRFNLGSTVILLFEPGGVRWDEKLAPGQRVRFGQRLGITEPAMRR